jgi:hypothetical protein
LATSQEVIEPGNIVLDEVKKGAPGITSLQDKMAILEQELASMEDHDEQESWPRNMESFRSDIRSWVDTVWKLKQSVSSRDWDSKRGISAGIQRN